MESFIKKLSNQIRYCMAQKQKWKWNAANTDKTQGKRVVAVNRIAVGFYSETGMLQGKKKWRDVGGGLGLFHGNWKQADYCWVFEKGNKISQRSVGRWVMGKAQN